jgi:hypothetical protein
MTFEDIINQLIDKLRAHAAGKLGHMQQEPYKGDLYRTRLFGPGISITQPGW